MLHNMKRLFATAVALIAVLFSVTSCGEFGKETYEGIHGTWKLVAFCGHSTDADIYITLNEDNTFTLYQREDDLGYSLFVGTYIHDEATSMVTGEYANGKPWNCAYHITTLDAKSLVWESDTEPVEVSEYRRSEAPKVVTDSRAVGDDVKPFL